MVDAMAQTTVVAMEERLEFLTVVEWAATMAVLLDSRLVGEMGEKKAALLAGTTVDEMVPTMVVEWDVHWAAYSVAEMDEHLVVDLVEP